MRKRTLATTLSAVLAAAALAGCGSSKAPGIQTAPSAGPTADTGAASTSTTSSATSASATATTPKPPSPLSKKPAVVVPTGPAPKKLVVKDLIKGTGTPATSSSTVTVNYVGALYSNGKEFDSSWKRNQPFTTPLTNGSVIPGWVQGIPGMRIGGRRELIIPPSLAYGSSAQSGIPANSTLVFVVDLLGVS
jgi:peptidylprolyl isomerase